MGTNFGGVHVGCHCWVPLGAIAGVPLLGFIAGWHCWVPLLGAIAGVPLLGAIAGCHCGVAWLDAIAGCHCWMLATNFVGVHVGCHCWVAIAGCPSAIAGFSRCHCWVPLRGKIDQSVTPFSAAPFSIILITHKLACAIWGLYWYNF